MQDDNHYKLFWDSYAQSMKRDGDRWPGDEWGTPKSWDRLFKTAFLDFGAAQWRNAVEIGAGSGKYTIKLLRNSPAHVLAADISPSYQEHFRTRLTEEKLIDRVTPLILDNNSATLPTAIDAMGWRGKLDGFFSMDAMVHVDLQYLIIYLVTAAACLRPGGKLVMTLSNCCSDLGFAKLVRDGKREFQRMGKLSAKFEWMSPDQVKFLFARLGFNIDLLDTSGRDILVVATLREPLTDPKILECIS